MSIFNWPDVVIYPQIFNIFLDMSVFTYLPHAHNSSPANGGSLHVTPTPDNNARNAIKSSPTKGNPPQLPGSHIKLPQTYRALLGQDTAVKTNFDCISTLFHSHATASDTYEKSKTH